MLTSVEADHSVAVRWVGAVFTPKYAQLRCPVPGSCGSLHGSKSKTEFGNRGRLLNVLCILYSLGAFNKVFLGIKEGFSPSYYPYCI